MIWRELPPLSALRAFAAFAQTGSVVAAGDALGVSHAAISQQLRSLEAHLDVALLERSGRALALTDSGADLAHALGTGFAEISAGVRRITQAQDARPLHVSTTPTFAASWLMPRLPLFRALNPDVDLMVDASAKVVDLSADGIDVALRYGRGNWPGLSSEMLVRSPLVVVAAPSLIGPSGIPSPSELTNLPWLEEFGTNESTQWLERNGVNKQMRRGVTQVPGNLLLDGARDGQGVACVVHAFVERDIASGRLIELAREDVQNSGYHIVTRPGVLRPALKEFLRWLRKQA